MNYTGSKLRGIKKNYETLSQGRHPKCCYRGSSPNIPPGFHFDKLLSVASPVEPPQKACGNDGHREGSDFHAASCGKFNPLRLNDEV
jgi:hypothetical protein